MTTAKGLTQAFINYVQDRNLRGLIDPVMTRSVRVNWEVPNAEFIPEGFPWKAAENATAATMNRTERYAALEANAELEGSVPRWATKGKKFLEGTNVGSWALVLGIVNQGFVPVKTYAQRREKGPVRLTVVLMDLEKARNHPVAELLNTEQAEFWRHRDIGEAMRSREVIWQNVTGYNNPVWNEELLSLEERSLDLTFAGRQEKLEPYPADHKKAGQPRGPQVQGVVRVQTRRIILAAA